MKFKNTEALSAVNILENDHYVAIPYDCSGITPDDDGVVKAGTVIPANDTTAIGVLLNDVVPADNPNGAVVVHGFIDKNKMPAAPSEAAITALKAIIFCPIASED